MMDIVIGIQSYLLNKRWCLNVCFGIKIFGKNNRSLKRVVYIVMHKLKCRSFNKVWASLKDVFLFLTSFCGTFNYAKMIKTLKIGII